MNNRKRWKRKKWFSYMEFEQPWFEGCVKRNSDGGREKGNTVRDWLEAYWEHLFRWVSLFTVRWVGVVVFLYFVFLIMIFCKSVWTEFASALNRKLTLAGRQRALHNTCGIRSLVFVTHLYVCYPLLRRLVSKCFSTASIPNFYVLNIMVDR